MTVRARRFALSSILGMLTLAALPDVASAQHLDGPIVVQPGGISPIRLATGRDGSILVLGDFSSSAIFHTVRFPAGQLTPASSTPFPDANPLGGTLTALRHGGYALAWIEPEDETDLQFHLATQRLSSNGEPLGVAIPAGPPANGVSDPGMAPLGDGFVLGWEQGATLSMRRFDVTGTPIGSVVNLGPEDDAANAWIVPVPTGFLMVWGRDQSIEARLFDPDGVPLTLRYIVASGLRLDGLAVNADGTLAAIVGRAQADEPDPGEIRLRFFVPDGSSIGTDIVIGPGVAGLSPKIASDPSGNFLVALNGPVKVLAYDSVGAALGTLAVPGSGNASTIGVAGRREGGYFLLWRSTDNKTRTAYVTLCTPGSAVCGDGTLVPTCEICDDGVANSDVTPDACRTDCRPAVCGDGVVDSGEQCDDGNAGNCDGCDEFCDLETGVLCGDGVLAPSGCHEQCDDANQVTGDGCSGSCQVEHIRGGGKLATDCWAAWRIDNPSNTPRYDKHGFVNPRQACADNDPACDFDGGVVGSCTFHLAVCANNSVPVECTPSRLRTWTIKTPSEKQASTRPPLAAARAALEAVVLPSIIGSSDPDVCSPDAAIVVPLRGAPGAYKANKLKLKTRAEVYSGELDSDGLELRCNPS